jgi:hypothetical protein
LQDEGRLVVPPAFTPSAFGTSPKFNRRSFMPIQILVLNLGEDDGGLQFALTGVPDSLIVASYFCENDVVKWISLSAQPSRTDRRLSVMSEQVLVFALSIERDYTLMEKRVKQEVVRKKEKGRYRFGVRIR